MRQVNEIIPSPNDDQVLFQEVQRFRQPWIVVVMLVCNLIFIALLGYVMLSLRGYPHPGKELAPDMVALYSICIFLVVVGFAVFCFSNLRTEVRRDGLYIRFSPFHRRFRKIHLDKLSSFRAITYRPIWEYGGWGIRFRPGGRAYNVRGRQGVRLELNNGKHLLIGSQKPDELAAAIQTLLKSSA